MQRSPDAAPSSRSTCRRKSRATAQRLGVALASLSDRVGITRVLMPLVVAVVASAGVATARHNPEKGAGIVAVAATVAVIAAVFGERGAAVAAGRVRPPAALPPPPR